ncbi:trypsin-like peptidase domain-containing protein [Planosporangium flavigriseum]|uniref:trypsin-like peptidase domain-containing protein n=1 Tax=Planosporangium flavigriseum TaxID=373681 RepID=UPI0035711FA2
MSDWGTRRQRPAVEAPGSWAHPEPGSAVPAPPPATGGQVGSANGAGSPWWSDALSDPWRDPAAPAAVVVTPPVSGAPPLEPVAVRPGEGVRPGLRLVVLVSVITALLAGALGGTLGFVFASRGGLGSGPQLGGGNPAPLTQRGPDSVAGVVKKVLPSVITVKVRGGGSTSLGSGFIVSSDGYAITNDHVVAGAAGSTVVTFSDGNTVAAKVVGSDPESDIAVLKVDATNLTPIQFGDSDSAQVGDPVLAIGSPLALANTVTYGIVSAVDRPIAAGESGGPTRYYAAIQTDAAVNQGNSGGPLVDGAGRVVGINAVIKSLAADQEQAGNVGLAFAIPINQAKRIAQDIVDTGKARRTVIGAELETTYRGAGGGVRLQTVPAGGPAAAAGLHPGDVLTRIGGAQVEEPGDLIALVRKYAPGTGVSVEYTRDGAKRSAQVVLAADGK